MPLLCQFHQYIGATDMVAPIYSISGTVPAAPIGEESLTFCESKNFADF